jgi:Tfp pilus assembly protein PilN
VSGQINLFNPIFLQQKKYFSAVTMAQAIGLIVLGSLLLTVYMTRQLSVLATQATKTTSLLTSKQAQLAKVNADYVIKPKSTALEAELAQMEDEMKSLDTVAGILKKGDFGNTVGYSEYMRAFGRQTPDGLWLTGFSIVGSGNEISVSGRTMQAQLVPVFIKRLSNEAALRGKSFAALEMQMAKKAEAAPRVDAVSGKTLPALRVPDYIEFTLQSSAIKHDAAAAEAK